MLFRYYILLFFQIYFLFIGGKSVCNDAKCIENHQQAHIRDKIHVNHMTYTRIYVQEH